MATTTTATTTSRARAVLRPAVLLPLGVLVALVMVVPVRHDGATAPIDYRESLAGARARAPYHVLAPQNLPAGWVATRAAYDPDADGVATWHLGFVTPTGRFAGVAQRSGSSKSFEVQQSNRGAPDGEMTLDGEPWRRLYRRTRDIHSLVRVSDGVTTVVSGNTTYDELAVLVRSLR
jgi:hypothetical protein